MARPDTHVVTIAASDGVRLAATRTGPRTGAATVVYVHGPLLCDRRVWASVTTRLHAHLDHAVTQLAYDQRGHGDSGAPARHDITTIGRLVDDLDAVLAHATPPVVLVAHGAAALLVHAYATRYHDHPLAGLVLLNPAAALPEYDCLPRYVRTWPQWLQRFRRIRGLHRTASVGEAILYRRLQHTGRRLGVRVRGGSDPRVTTDVLAAFPPVPLLSGEGAARLRGTRVLVLAGQGDPIVPPRQVVRLADAIWADYQLVLGAGHDLPGTDPARVVDAILQILGPACHTEDGLPGTDPVFRR
ncbi:pimeloyl-ACP methyl ester carboxylesterase [Nocardia sp. GAS34]|uniref:alpha/beta hydrolase n=1 Tax=unclassified Nocardia TaxID=2637762 RepID=UPI003D1B6F9D